MPFPEPLPLLGKVEIYLDKCIEAFRKAIWFYAKDMVQEQAEEEQARFSTTPYEDIVDRVEELEDTVTFSAAPPRQTMWKISSVVGCLFSEHYSRSNPSEQQVYGSCYGVLHKVSCAGNKYL